MSEHKLDLEVQGVVCKPLRQDCTEAQLSGRDQKKGWYWLWYDGCVLTRKESSHCWVEWTVRAEDIGVIKFLTLPNKLVQIKRDTQSSLIFDHIIERMQELSETTMWICTNVPLSDWMLSLIRGEGLADRWLKGATQTTKWMQFTSLFRKKYHQG